MKEYCFIAILQKHSNKGSVSLPHKYLSMEVKFELARLPIFLGFHITASIKNFGGLFIN